jgi:hypothetical protein
VKAFLEGPNIRIYIDDVLILDYTHTDNPLLFGRFYLETLGDSCVQFDDVIVTDLNHPEIACGSDIVSEGGLLSLDISLTQNASKVAGFQFDVGYDPSLLQVTNVVYGHILNGNDDAAYYNPPTIDNTAGKVRGILGVRTTEGGLRIDGILATIVFKALRIGESVIELQNVKLSDRRGQEIEITVVNGRVDIHIKVEGDVNCDGIVDIEDLIAVAGYFGETPTKTSVDLNGDGNVDVLDLILVARCLANLLQIANQNP